MNPYLANPENITIAIVLAVLIVGSAWLYIHKRRTTTAGLRQRFGTEYEPTVQTQGAERKGQAKLLNS